MQCPECFAQPVAADTYNSTWHDGGTGNGSWIVFNGQLHAYKPIDLTKWFLGTDIYIYGVDILDPGTVIFTLDGSTPASHSYDGSGYVYNSLFFAAHSLSPNVPEHNLSWVVDISSVGGGACIFDYAIVTTPLDTDV